MSLLKFSNGNSKLAQNIFTFSLPAGYACPGAHNCKSQCVKTSKGYRLKDGPQCQFRCFAAIDEVLKPNVRALRWHNFNLLKGKTKAELVKLIQTSLPHPRWKFMVRLHVSGDFFSQAYFDAWREIARRNPKIVFYCYTKSLPFWIARLGSIPKNLRLSASLGGIHDRLVFVHGLKRAVVVYSEAEAEDLDLEIDHDDSHVYEGTKNFALLLHGTQPKGSEAGQAWQRLKEIGKGGYHNQKRGRGWGGKDYMGKPLPKNYGGGTPPPSGMLTVAHGWKGKRGTTPSPVGMTVIEKEQIGAILNEDWENVSA